MTARLRMDAPDDRNRLDDMVQGVLGEPLDRPEGRLKATGRAPYSAEVLPEGLAYGVLVRATVTRGQLRDLGATAARAMPGVLALLSDPRMLRNPAQGTAGKAPVQGPDDVFYLGQPIALVVAESFEQARHAAQSLHPVFDVQEGRTEPEAPDLEPERPKAKQTDIGDVDAAMTKAAFSVDRIWRTPGHSSAAMEPHAAVAVWKGDTLELRGSYQMLKYNRNELADALGIKPKHVRLLAPFVGGGFGAKLGISHEAVAAALAARELGRPVMVVLSRHQVFEATMRRSETRQRIRLAAGPDGRLTGISHESLVSNLPGESYSENVAQATHFLYAGASRRVVHDIARVHRTCAGSVRAPGEAVGVTVLENAMDELAEATGLDPIDLRLRNIPARHPEEDKPFSSHTLAEALYRGAELFDWSRRKAPRRGPRWRMADRHRRRLGGPRQHADRGGGAGHAAALRPGAGRDRHDRYRHRHLRDPRPDRRRNARAASSRPSRSVSATPNCRRAPVPAAPGARRRAARRCSSLARSLRGRICKVLGCAADELTLKDGRAIAGNRSLPIAEVLAGEAWEATGHIEPGKTGKAVRQATFGAHFAEVAVSAVTGETRVRRMLGVFAAGRILNPKTARSQCFGGMTFGIGMALTEELVHDPRDGHLVNHDLAEYHLPVNRDVPQLEVEFLDERDPWASPLQSKGIGELSICGSAAAITNAIYNACGVRVRDYPATLDKILAHAD